MKSIKKLSLSALFAAFCLVATAVIAIPLPTGYANLGDCFAFAAGFILGMPWGIAAAGIGSALADLLLGYAVYMPATAILKALIAVAGALCAKIIMRSGASKTCKAVMLPVCSIIGEAVMVTGYFAYEYFAMGLKEAAFASVLANCTQAVVGVIASVAVATVFIKVPALARLIHTKNESNEG